MKNQSIVGKFALIRALFSNHAGGQKVPTIFI
jgi:hypothetical protein